MAILQKKNRKRTSKSSVIDMEKAREERRLKREKVTARKKKKQKKPAEPVSKRRFMKQWKRRTVYLTIILALLIIVGVSTFKLVSLKMEQARVTAEYNALLEQKAAMEEELKNVDSDEYIEQKAREELKMILPGETLYMISGSEAEKAAETDETED